MIGIAIIILIPSGVIFILLAAISLYRDEAPPAFVSIVMITSLSELAVFLALRARQPLKRFLLRRFGVETTATIIESSGDCNNDEDKCYCGRYQYLGPNGRAYRAKFWICIHWPSDEQGTLMKQGYSKGALNPVRYLRWFPRIHEVSFPI
jgi:hypothetical protein